MHGNKTLVTVQMCVIVVLMNDAVTRLKSYCQELAGASVPIAIAEGAQSRLPTFLSQFYQTLKGELFDRQWIFLARKPGANPTPAEAANHARLAAKALNAQVVLVFSALASFDRKRLVQRRVPFIVVGRQVFLPTHFIDLREKSVGSDLGLPEGRLSTPTQVLLLFHLLNHSGLPERPLNEWAAALKYSRMTLTRAAQELVNAGVATRREKGRVVLLGFSSDRRRLWELAVPLLSDPVARRTHAFVKGDIPSGALEAGLTALAHHSDIAEGRQRVLAMSGQTFKSAKQRGLVEVVRFPEPDTTTFEEWRYSPDLLSKDGRSVDPLSLYLSLHALKDERVESALKQILKGIQW
jgi:DNA-binding MarR family transcriptional regulator